MNMQDVKFTSTHEWAYFDPASGLVTVGITSFAAEQLGDIVFLELPNVGVKVELEASFGVVESVKAAVDLNSPLSGKVVEANQSLVTSFDILRSDPYGGGWMIKIMPDDVKQLDSLMSAAQYEQFVQAQEH